MRVEDRVFVTGTTSFDEDGTIIGQNDAYAQTIQCIKNIEKALLEASSSLNDVVRTRMFVTDIDLWSEIGKAHSEYFREIRPATTMVEVSRLIHPDMIVEIEADAIILDQK